MQNEMAAAKPQTHSMSFSTATATATATVIANSGLLLQLQYSTAQLKTKYKKAQDTKVNNIHSIISEQDQQVLGRASRSCRKTKTERMKTMKK